MKLKELIAMLQLIDEAQDGMAEAVLTFGSATGDTFDVTYCISVYTPAGGVVFLTDAPADIAVTYAAHILAQTGGRILEIPEDDFISRVLDNAGLDDDFLSRPVTN